MTVNETAPGNKTPSATVYDINIIGITIFTISLLGVIANVIVAVFTKKLPTMNNPFGRLSASQSTGEAILCAIFCFYFSPMVFFDVEWMIQQSKHAGWILVICYDICIWSHLFIALNRLVAICFIRHYNLIFSLIRMIYSMLLFRRLIELTKYGKTKESPTTKRNTRIMIIITWTIAICTSTTFHKIFDCDVFYYPQVWAFVFSRNPTCDFLSMTVSFYKDITIVSIIGFLDVITLINVHQTNRAALLQGVVFALELFTYFIFAWKFENRWATWALSTLAWVSVHTIDGWIIILFNSEFRRLIVSPLRRLDDVQTAAGTLNKESLARETDFTAAAMTSDRS